jgi:hypothetical protein
VSYKPLIEAVGKAKIRCELVRVLAALSACAVFCAYFIPFTHGSVSGSFQPSRDLETDSARSGVGVSGLVLLPAHDTGTSHKRFVLAGDSLPCVETEDLDSLEEDPGHPQVFPEASLIPLGELSCQDSTRTSFLPFLAIQGLMSRRF